MERTRLGLIKNRVRGRLRLGKVYDYKRPEYYR